MPKNQAAAPPFIQTDLFTDAIQPALPDVVMAEGATLLRGFAKEQAPALLHAVQTVIAQAPLRHMVTPGGYRMSVAMTNCGKTGWITDHTGYRYAALDPVTGRAWPARLSVASGLSLTAQFTERPPPGTLFSRVVIKHPARTLTLSKCRLVGATDQLIFVDDVYDAVIVRPIATGSTGSSGAFSTSASSTAW